AWLGEHGVAPAGPPFIRVREIDRAGEPLLLEAAAPVAPGTSGGGPVVADTLPAGRYATLLHVGPYRSDTRADLSPARDVLVRWADDNGITYGHATDRGTALPCCVDHLMVGPVDDPDFTKWETE